MLHVQFQQQADLGIFQEVYITKEGLPVGSTSHNKIFLSHNKLAMIVYNGAMNPMVWRTTNHTIAIILDSIEGSLMVISCYFPPSLSINDLLTELDFLHHTPLTHILICGDFNAANRLWGSPTDSPRSFPVIDFISSHGLVILNKSDSPPTFDTIRARGWPDLSLATPQLSSHIAAWTVADFPSLSDHQAIMFNLQSPRSIVIKQRFKTAYGGTQKLEQHLSPFIPSIKTALQNSTTRAALDKAYDQLIDQCTDACRKTFKTKKIKIRTSASWWTPQLSQERSKLRKLRRQAQSTQEPMVRRTLFARYKIQQAQYKRQISIAKQDSWHR
ncbi:uncharacterized protein LOC118205374 [Stegodyphus dumicola]|uniref:uncharacterized protein LOC118205374 n=1 Tax=Stegodyphus dumicola TaxID=202533 RepID=UPI0015B0A558|nr:uncharacterized protein LOC118205374 [Stegodyphus dumicola]